MLVACSAAPVRTGAPPPHRAFRLGAILRGLAGPGAIDCGSAPYVGDRSPVDACVARAFRSKRPFFATYENRDPEIEDLVSADGFVATPSNAVFFFTYGFAPYHVLDPPEEFVLRGCSKARIVSGTSGHETLACW